MALCPGGHNAISVCFWNLASVVNITSRGRIEYNRFVYRTISLLRQQKYHAVQDSISLKAIGKCALVCYTGGGADCGEKGHRVWVSRITGILLASESIRFGRCAPPFAGERSARGAICARSLVQAQTRLRLIICIHITLLRHQTPQFQRSLLRWGTASRWGTRWSESHNLQY